MALIIAEFFAVTGINATPPDTMAELIPYLLTVVIGLVLVSGVFRVIGGVAEFFLNWRRW